MKRKETYLSRDFRETAAQRFPTQAKQLNVAFDARLNALLARTSHKQIAALLHIPGLYRLVPGVFVKSTRSVFGPAAGFAPKELQTGNGVWRVDMMKCPYHDTCTEYGCPELCCCFCDSDDISYTGLHPKLIWERSMTLGRGNDRCDFCMKVEK